MPPAHGKNQGHIITEDILAALVGDAFAQSHTPLNILLVLKKPVYIKTFFSKVCRQHMVKNQGHIITEDILAALVGDAFAQSHTPLNILGGIKKASIYPGEESDRQLAPSKALKKPTRPAPFSPEQVALFEQRYAEGYDVLDPAYLAWKNENHPSPESISSIATPTSSTGSSTSVLAKTTSTNAATSVSIISAVSVVTTPSKVQSKFSMNC